MVKDVAFLLKALPCLYKYNTDVQDIVGYAVCLFKVNKLKVIYRFNHILITQKYAFSAL